MTQYRHGKKSVKWKKVSKWKRIIRKGRTSLFVFGLWNFRLVPIDSELNSALAVQTYFLYIFYKNWGQCREKQPNLNKWDKILQKRPLPQNSKVLEPNVFTGRCPGTVLVKWPFSDFDPDPLTFGFGGFPARNSQNMEKSNRISPGKTRGERALILQYLDNPMA